MKQVILSIMKETTLLIPVSICSFSHITCMTKRLYAKIKYF